ncbi:hypothetical protein HZA57_03465 [Candidatus Poribacteria bacterium]|nr:hypothetical protein [Candidatus Poribacteria bacterium]
MVPAGSKPRQARLLEGEIQFERPVFECPRCRRSLAPVDQELGLEAHGQMSRSVRKKVAYAAAHASFAGACKDLLHQAELSVSDSEIARTAETEGARLDALQREREEAYCEPVVCGRPVAKPEFSPTRLVIEADATSVLTVRGEEHKMVWCATAYDLDSVAEGDGGKHTQVLCRRYSASSGDLEDFEGRFDALGNRMGARGAEQIAFLADGQECLWTMASERLSANTIPIQDIMHVAGHLADLAKALHGPGTEATALDEPWKEDLLNSEVQSLIAELVELRPSVTGHTRECLDSKIRYLETGKHRMDYARYRREGWPIGSGMAEGTCKNLIKERYNKTGARWKRARIHHVLALRLSIFNDEWEADWEHAVTA